MRVEEEEVDPEALNEEETAKLQSNPVYKEYVEWLKANGVVVNPSVLYPAYFGPKKRGVVGVAANKPIPGSCGIIAVPYDLIITVEKVRADPTLASIIS
jgi:hypothetical protein